MIRRNSSWLTTPSPSRSASSIISWKNVLVASNVQGFGSNLLLWKSNSQMWNSIQFYPKLFTQQKLEFRCLKDELEKLHLKPVEWIMLNLWFVEFISIIKSFPKGWLPVILFRLSKEIFPVSSSSNNLNAFKISSFVSFSDIFVDIKLKKLSNVKRPVLSLSTSYRW